VVAVEACCGAHRATRLQSLHRVRDRLVGERTALINQLRAVLMSMASPFRELEQHLAVILYGKALRLALSEGTVLVCEHAQSWPHMKARARPSFTTECRNG
jgi:transposase